MPNLLDSGTSQPCLSISRMAVPGPCTVPIPKTLDDFFGRGDFNPVYNQFETEIKRWLQEVLLCIPRKALHTSIQKSIGQRVCYFWKYAPKHTQMAPRPHTGCGPGLHSRTKVGIYSPFLTFEAPCMVLMYVYYDLHDAEFTLVACHPAGNDI